MTIYQARGYDKAAHVGIPVYCGRKNPRVGGGESPLHNPFYPESKCDVGRNKCCDEFDEYFWSIVNGTYQYYPWSKIVMTELDRLVELAMTSDITLLCWCYPLRCHTDTIKSYLLKEAERRMSNDVRKYDILKEDLYGSESWDKGSIELQDYIDELGDISPKSEAFIEQAIADNLEILKVKASEYRFDVIDGAKDAATDRRSNAGDFYLRSDAKDALNTLFECHKVLSATNMEHNDISLEVIDDLKARNIIDLDKVELNEIIDTARFELPDITVSNTKNTKYMCKNGDLVNGSTLDDLPHIKDWLPDSITESTLMDVDKARVEFMTRNVVHRLSDSKMLSEENAYIQSIDLGGLSTGYIETQQGGTKSHMSVKIETAFDNDLLELINEAYDKQQQYLGSMKI